MKFKIASRKDVCKYSQKKHNEKSIIISITDSLSCNAKIFKNPEYNGIIAVKHIKFDDVLFGEPNCITPAKARAIADFVKEHSNSSIDMIIIHCEVGLCRSSGVCAAIMKFFNEEYEAIFKSKVFKPNIACFKLVCDALGAPVDKKELYRLQNLNAKTWASRNVKEEITFLMHIIKSNNVPHLLHQAKIAINRHYYR
jgi:predicted protein tyrosine phosphatase